MTSNTLPPCCNGTNTSVESLPLLQVLRLARPSDADESDSEIADPEEESCSISHELAPVLVKLAEAWTQLLEAIPELQLQAPAKRGAAPPSNGSCTRTALEQLERQAGKVSLVVPCHLCS